MGVTITGDLFLDNPSTAGRDIKFDVSDNALKISDNVNLNFGDGNDLKLYHDGSNSTITNTTGDLYITDSGGNIYIQSKAGEQSIVAFADGAVDLYHNNSKKFETTSAGNQIYGNLVCGSVTLDGGGLALSDNDKLKCGNGDDLQIYHDGTHSRIRHDGTGKLTVLTDGWRVNNAANTESLIVANANLSVDLYYDNDRKFRTTSTGCQVESVSGDTHLIVRAEGDDASTDAILRLSVNNTSATSILQFGDNDSSSVGMVLYEHLDDSMRFRTNGSEHWRITSAGNLENNNDTGRIKLGTSDDLQIYHDGTHSHIKDASSGELLLSGSTISLNSANSQEYMLKGSQNGATELYYDNSKSLRLLLMD